MMPNPANEWKGSGNKSVEVLQLNTENTSAWKIIWYNQYFTKTIVKDFNKKQKSSCSQRKIQYITNPMQVTLKVKSQVFQTWALNVSLLDVYLWVDPNIQKNLIPTHIHFSEGKISWHFQTKKKKKI